jgi:uncharacterized protein YecE (DUF72 family)
MGCCLFQLPPSYRYTKVRLKDIVSQLDRARRNVVEFRHASWWNEEVYGAFREAGIIFCSCSGPRLPADLIRTADEVYVRLHGPKRWYRHDYSKDELADWANKIKDSGAKRTWVYFNNGIVDGQGADRLRDPWKPVVEQGAAATPHLDALALLAGEDTDRPIAFRRGKRPSHAEGRHEAR